MDTFWIVWSPGHGIEPMKYENEKRARDTAKGMAISYPGEEFFVLRATHRVSVPEPSLFEEALGA